MFTYFIKLCSVCLIVSLTGCKTTPKNDTPLNQDPSHLGGLIISEPLTVDFTKEITLARISEFLQNQELDAQQRAKAFYDRGLLYDSFGLPSLARLDFNRALRVDPKMADAYNFIGIHYTLIGQFAKAYESFDATIELSPDHQYVYLNRGISLYYGGQHKLAVDDLTTFYQFDKTDPYRIIWRYLAEYKLDKAMANKHLKASRSLVSETDWGRQIIDLYLMNMSQAQFIAQLTQNIETQQQLAERLCEAYFYLGTFARLYNQPQLALNYFKLALSTNVYEFVEHRYARRELLEARLQLHKKQLNNQSQQQGDE